MSFTTISVIVLGYIGLPTAAAFASRQQQVVGVDINARAVETINRGEIHIVEPDLDRVVKEAVEGGFLRASATPVEADACAEERGAGDPGIDLSGRRYRADGTVAGRGAS